jgi:hypothetical protein
MNRIMKNGKVVQRAALFCGVALAGLFACQKIDTGTPEAILSENSLKAASLAATSEVFDEVMEIGDETLTLFENLIHGKDSLDRDSAGGHHGHHGNHGMGGHMERDTLDSIWHHGDSLRIGDLDHLLDSMGPNHGHYRLGNCTKISRAWAGDTLVTTINYGTDSCVGFDGKVRRGKIIMKSVGDYWKGDALVTFNCVDYYVDDNQVLGSTTVNSTINADGNRESQILEEGSIILGDGTGTILWSSEKTRILTEGTKTRGKHDDLVEVTGTSTGTLLSGNTFTSHTESPLVRDMGKECLGVYISGVISISVSDGTLITVDYGDGTCDNLATVTTNGASETITLDSFLPKHGRHRH